MPYPPYLFDLPEPEEDTAPEWKPGSYRLRPDMSDSDLAAMLGLDMPEDEPEAEMPGMAPPGFMERLGAATGGMQMGAPRDFGTGLLQGLVGGLGAQGRKIAQTREKVTALDEARRKTADAARIQASRNYRLGIAQARAKIEERGYTERRDLEKYERDNQPLTDKDIADNPWLVRAGLKVGDRPPDFVRKAVLETVTPETPRERATRERAEATAARLEGAARTTADNARISNINKLADDFRADPDVKEFPAVRDAYRTGIESSRRNNSAGDIILMRMIAKTTDPTTGVREEEFKTFEGAQGTLARYGIRLTTDMWGGGRLTPYGRDQLTQILQGIYDRKAGTYSDAEGYHATRAERLGIDPQDVVRSYLPDDKRKTKTKLRERGMQFVEP